MNRDQITTNQIRLSFLISCCILGLIFLTPNSGHEPSWTFFHGARAASWNRLFDWGAAWCSFKIILSSLALFLILDALGTLFVRARRMSLGALAFFSLAVPCVGFLVGGYYLLKALL